MDEQIFDLLDRLESHPVGDLESDLLDFKEWADERASLKVAIEYAVCFANGNGGVVVFGVRDKVKGREQAIAGVPAVDLDRWKQAIYEGTRPGLTVELSTLVVPEGTGSLLVMRMPSGIQKPYCTTAGLYKVRVGKSCMPLTAAGFRDAQVRSGALDWSAQAAQGATLGDIDPLEVERGRKFLRRAIRDSSLLKGDRDDRAFLTAMGVLVDGRVTNAALLLFGREEVIRRVIPQHQVHYVHQVSPVRVAANESWCDGLLAIIERLEEIFQGPVNPERELSFGFSKIRIPAFDVGVVREAVLNAVTHRDYLAPNEVFVRHKPDQLVVSSPGGFLGGITPENIRRQEPFARNRRLAEAFQHLRLVERAGIGRERIFHDTLRFGRLAPQYEADAERVTLRVYGGEVDERMAKLIAKWSAEGKDLWVDSLLILGYLKTHQYLQNPEAAELLQSSPREALDILELNAAPSVAIVERIGRSNPARYHLARGVARELLGKAAYTRAKGRDPSRDKEAIRNFVRDHGSIGNSEVRELLGLGDTSAAKTEASRTLRELSGPEELLEKHGPKNRPSYRLRSTSTRGL